VRAYESERGNNNTGKGRKWGAKVRERAREKGQDNSAKILGGLPEPKSPSASRRRSKGAGREGTDRRSGWICFFNKSKESVSLQLLFFFFASFRPSSHTHTHSRSAGEPKIERKNRRNRDPGEIPLHYRRWLFVESSPAIGGPFPKRARLPHPRSRLLQPSRKAGGDLRLCLPVSLPLPVLSPLCCGEMRFRKAEERGGVCVCSVFVLKSASAAGALWPFYPAAILRSAARDLSHV